MESKKSAKNVAARMKKVLGGLDLEREEREREGVMWGKSDTRKLQIWVASQRIDTGL